MKQIKIKKRARTIPFGFKQSQDPEYIEPVKEELDAASNIILLAIVPLSVKGINLPTRWAPPFPS